MLAEVQAPTRKGANRVRSVAVRLLRGRGVRNLGWGVADQGLSSLTNVILTLSVAQTLGAEHFGAFSLAYVTYWFILTASHALSTDPLMVRFGGADMPTWRRAIAGSSGTAAAVGLAATACLLAVAGFTGGTIRHAFAGLALVVPGLLIQDSWRYAFFAVGRGGHAFLNDVIRALALVPAIVLVRVTGHQSVFWFVVAWGAAAAVAAVAGSLQTRVLPRLSASRSWLSQHRDLAFRYLAEGASSSAATQIRAYGIGLILGLAAVGYVQAAYTVMGPVMIIMFGTSAAVVPEIARVFRRSPRQTSAVCLAYGGALAAAALAWGVVLLVALPLGLGDLLLRQMWEPTYPLVQFVTLAFMGAGFQAGAGSGMRALGAARRGLRAMLLSSIAVVAGGLVGAALGGTVGTAIGAAAAAWIGAMLGWWQLRAALREAVVEPPTSSRHLSGPAERSTGPAGEEEIPC